MIVFTTCNKNNQPIPPGNENTIPPPTYYYDTLKGYIYLNCSNTPATNYILFLTNYDEGQVGTYTTDNTGYYSIPYSFFYSQGIWFPDPSYVLYVSKDSLITLVVPNDSVSGSRNLNVVLGDSLHYKAVFTFSQSYTNQDTLYYQFYNGQNSPIQYLVGPFSNRVVLSYNKPVKYLQLNSGGSSLMVIYGLGINNFKLGQNWGLGQGIRYFPYKQCSNVDSVVINY